MFVKGSAHRPRTSACRTFPLAHCALAVLAPFRNKDTLHEFLPPALRT